VINAVFDQNKDCIKFDLLNEQCFEG